MINVKFRIVDRDGRPIKKIPVFYYDRRADKWISGSDTSSDRGEVFAEFYDYRVGSEIAIYVGAKYTSNFARSFIAGSESNFSATVK